MKLSQKGVIPLPLLLAAGGVLLFLVITSFVPFKDNLFNSLYPKPDSKAADVDLTQWFTPQNIGAPNTVVINPGSGVMYYPWKSAARENKDYIGGRATGPDTFIGSTHVFDWAAIEQTQGNYQWAILEKFLIDFPRTGQQVWVRIRGDNIAVPNWAWSKGIPRVNGFPVYWNSTYKQLWSAFIQALAAKYDGDPRIAGFEVEGQGHYGEMIPEWPWPLDAAGFNAVWDRWVAAGYTYPIFIQHQKDMIDLFLGNFKKTPVNFQISRKGVLRGEPSSEWGAKVVLDWAINKYGMRVMPKFSGATQSLYSDVTGQFLQYLPATNIMYEENLPFVPNSGSSQTPQQQWQELANRVMGSRAFYLYVYDADFDNSGYLQEMERLAKYLGPQIFIANNNNNPQLQISGTPGQTVNFTIQWGNRGNMPLRKPSNLITRINNPGCTGACQKDDPISADIFVDLVSQSSGQTVFHHVFTPNPSTIQWYPNSIVDNNISLPLPGNIPSGTYDLRVGVYNPYPSARKGINSTEFINFRLLNTNLNDGTDRYTVGTINISGVPTSPPPSSPLPSPSPSPIPSITPTPRPSVNPSPLASPTNPPTGTKISQGKPAVASSQPFAGYEASKVTDGNSTTRWSSGKTDSEWLYVDLGAKYDLSKVIIRWESYAYGTDYRIDVSDDKVSWRTAFTRNGFTGGADTINLSASGRYVRFQGVKRRDPTYLYSIFEFEVYGTASITKISQGKPVIASSQPFAGYEASKVTDGNSTTRWSSGKTDGEWVYIDLGSSKTLSKVVLKWESYAYGTDYRIDVSDDRVNWRTAFTRTGFTGGADTINLSASGRYVRFQGVKRRDPTYLYSIFEFEVYGTSI